MFCKCTGVFYAKYPDSEYPTVTFLHVFMLSSLEKLFIVNFRNDIKFLLNHVMLRTEKE